ncbi:hypothetical protein KTAU_13800 [Thermogemmatispora aurantia]|jgi:hypothetical protein|uniref:Uncharacterized protein n=1 Tax=Thermogemmatispora aurantia TaxID=2045279 RepID=A0A5J4K5G6_9CHLR|nr:hypothetical protein [Thermogemmatispora aurantia]GER82743.1 hypothetical protein KTAU_13800 [Thermogemmatispora aurantia]
MILTGRVESAQVGMFGDSIDLVVVDREVLTPRGERPQYHVKLIGGWPGLEELRALQREVKAGRKSQEELLQMAQRLQVPEQDQLMSLVVVDKRAKGFLQLVAMVTR